MLYLEDPSLGSRALGAWILDAVIIVEDVVTNADH